MVSGTKKQQEDKKLILNGPTGFDIKQQNTDFNQLNPFIKLHIPPKVPPNFFLQFL